MIYTLGEINHGQNISSSTIWALTMATEPQENVANPHTDLMQIFYLNPLTTQTPQTILYDLFTTCGKGVLGVAQRNLSLRGNSKFSSESAEKKKAKHRGDKIAER